MVELPKAPKLSEMEDPFPLPVSPGEFKKIVDSYKAIKTGAPTNLPLHMATNPEIGKPIIIEISEGRKNMGIVKEVERLPSRDRITTNLGTFEGTLLDKK